MIEQYLTPNTSDEAIKLKEQYGNDAIWFAGGSKINATPTKTENKVAIYIGALNLDRVELKGDTLYIGAMCRIQQLMDLEFVPPVLKQSAGFIYSRHVRNQATVGGEIAALQKESLIVPSLMALRAKLKLITGVEVDIEDYISGDRSELIETIIIPDRHLACTSNKITRSAGGMAILTGAVSIDKQGHKVIALDGICSSTEGYSSPIRLRDVETTELEGDLLEQAVSEVVNPKDDICGSAQYKKYIAGILVTDLISGCQRLVEEASL